MRGHAFRISLTVGVSLAAVALSMPVFAAQTSTTVPGADLPPDYTIDAGTTVNSGQDTTGDPVATTVVASVANGTYSQTQAGENPDFVPDLLLVNNGTVFIGASATATVGMSVADTKAQSTITDAISQIITAPNTDITATLLNTGSLTIASTANADATNDLGIESAADASSTLIGGVHQEATVEGGGAGSATVTGTNEGTYVASSTATAISNLSNASAEAILQEAIFMRSQGNGAGDATTLTTLNNDGTLDFSATASSTSLTGDATADASAGGGEHGLIHIRAAANGVGADTATAVFNNGADGTLDVLATANAVADGTATANALADGAIVMKAQASGQDDGDVSLTLANDGAITIGADATATSTGEAGSAYATSSLSSAIVQTTEAGGPDSYIGRSGVDVINNTGSISISGSSAATAADYASASTYIGSGILQESEMTGTAETTFINTGSVSVMGDATASAATASAETGVVGIEQELFGLGAGGGGLAAFDNSGSIAVGSSATATGSAATSYSGALGYKVWGEPINLALSNAGDFSVSSTSVSDGTAYAGALGIGIYATYNPTIVVPEEEEGHGHGGSEVDEGHNGHGGSDSEEPVVWEDVATNAVSGTIENSGTLTVLATATGGTALTPDGLITPQIVVEPSAYAQAGGIYIEGAVVNATLTNSGSINVSAVTDGGTSEAYGIVVRDFTDSPVLPTEADVFTLVNDGGSIVARTSVDGGTTWQHGVAIDTVYSPNRVDMQFTGNGSIYGDILMSADDSITVSNGVTVLDGVINPASSDMVPAETVLGTSSGLTTLASSSTLTPLAAGPVGSLVGTLTIANGGTLYLADQPNDNPSYAGPAAVNVDAFTVESGGTLALQMPTSPIPATATAAYPYVNANTATLAGKLLIDLATPNGLYGDTYSYPDIIAAGTTTGTFSSVVTSTGTPLLTPVVTYQADNTVDLAINRVPFGAVPGLTFNQTATGNGIESVYSPVQTGDFGTLLADLFLQTPTTYPAALDQISGDQYAGYIQNLRNTTLQTDMLVSDQMDCAISKKGVEMCREPNYGLRLWGLAAYNDSSVDTDVNAPGYGADGYSMLLGLDYTVGHFTIGAFGGYRKSQASFDRNNGAIDADGYQIGGVAGFDNGTVYLRANGGYTSLSGDSTRTITLLPSTSGTVNGKPSFDVWSVYGELGARVPLGAAWLTPFVAIDHASVKMKGFTETGVPGANLEFADQTQKQTSYMAGLKLAGKIGGIVPEAKVMYRHDDGDPFFTSTARFADGPAGGLFTVRSPVTDKDSVMAGFSLAAGIGDMVTGRVGYQGRFASGLRDNAFYGSLVVRFGHKAAPPPPPAPPAPVAEPPAPPPPPPPAPAPVCNHGPYIVFFDWDKADVTAEASSVLDNAITAYGSCDSVPIMLAGYTDRSGTVPYNMGLSARRNASVRAYLTTHGVPDASITSQAFGESNPRVPTADGVRELQNRRVEITYGPGSGN